MPVFEISRHDLLTNRHITIEWEKHDMRKEFDLMKTAFLENGIENQIILMTHTLLTQTVFGKYNVADETWFQEEVSRFVEEGNEILLIDKSNQTSTYMDIDFDCKTLEELEEEDCTGSNYQ